MKVIEGGLFLPEPTLLGSSTGTGVKKWDTPPLAITWISMWRPVLFGAIHVHRVQVLRNLKPRS